MNKIQKKKKFPIRKKNLKISLNLVSGLIYPIKIDQII